MRPSPGNKRLEKSRSTGGRQEEGKGEKGKRIRDETGLSGFPGGRGDQEDDWGVNVKAVSRAGKPAALLYKKD